MRPDPRCLADHRTQLADLSGFSPANNVSALTEHEALAQVAKQLAAQVGPGRMVALHYRSSTSCHIHSTV